VYVLCIFVPRDVSSDSCDVDWYSCIICTGRRANAVCSRWTYHHSSEPWSYSHQLSGGHFKI